MKKIIATIAIVEAAFLLCAFLLCSCCNASTHTDTNCVISEIDNDIVYVVASDGNEYGFYGDGYSEGQSVSVVFDNKGRIVDVK